MLVLVAIATYPAYGAETTFDPNSWIEDLRQIRVAFSEKYANFEWAVMEREIDLSDLFARTEARLREAASDEDAKSAIDRLTRTLSDGHVRIQWPATRSGATATSVSSARSDVCQSLGYEAAKSGRTLGPHIPGYQALPNDAASADFPAGIVLSGRRKIGVVRIGLFSPQGYPEVCKSALNALGIAPDASCDQQCADRVGSAAYDVMSREVASRIRALKSLGATALVIDVTGNGGGSEWAEAAARIVSPLRLRSERRDVVRGEHWAKIWESIAQDLRQAQNTASAADKESLDLWAQQVDRARTEAMSPCSSAQFWLSQRPDCEWLARGFYATGILGEGDAVALRNKPWGSVVFSPAKYDFEAAVWRGPLLVLVDGGTGSAAEEFAAVLQDNKAAVVIGAPTAGAGCGYTDGGMLTTLTHSRGILRLPDCARIRLSGSNEISGIDPDILIGFRWTDGMRRKALRLASALPHGVKAAVQLCKRERCERQGVR